MSRDRLLTIEQVAEILQVDPRTVSRMISSGKLKTVFVGGGLVRRCRRVTREALSSYVTASLSEATREG